MSSLGTFCNTYVCTYIVYMKTIALFQSHWYLFTVVLSKVMERAILIQEKLIKFYKDSRMQVVYTYIYKYIKLKSKGPGYIYLLDKSITFKIYLCVTYHIEFIEIYILSKFNSSSISFVSPTKCGGFILFVDIETKLELSVVFHSGQFSILIFMLYCDGPIYYQRGFQRVLILK